MRTPIIALSLFALVASATPGLVAQEVATPAVPAVVEVITPLEGKSTEQLLAEIKLTNEKTLESQAALLKRLEELKKQADQLRIFARRG